MYFIVEKTHQTQIIIQHRIFISSWVVNHCRSLSFLQCDSLLTELLQGVSSNGGLQTKPRQESCAMPVTRATAPAFCKT